MDFRSHLRAIVGQGPQPQQIQQQQSQQLPQQPNPMLLATAPNAAVNPVGFQMPLGIPTVMGAQVQQPQQALQIALLQQQAAAVAANLPKQLPAQQQQPAQPKLLPHVFDSLPPELRDVNTSLQVRDIHLLSPYLNHFNFNFFFRSLS